MARKHLSARMWVSLPPTSWLQLGVFSPPLQKLRRISARKPIPSGVMGREEKLHNADRAQAGLHHS
jgi:hypothetical protein